jgi:hypothetical protein
MALTDDLISHWKLEETGAATRADSHGSNTLTATNAPSSGTGKIGNGVDLEFSSSQSLSVASNASLTTGNIDFAIAAWVNLESKIADEMTVAAKTEAGNGEWWLDYTDNSDRWRFSVYSAAGFGGAGIVSANNYGSPPTATWAFLFVWHDSVNNTVNIQVDDGTIDSVAHSAGVNSLTGNFFIGSDPFANFFDGIIDEVSFWKRIPDADERTWLYNAGAGRSFDEWSSYGASPAAKPFYIPRRRFWRG